MSKKDYYVQRALAKKIKIHANPSLGRFIITSSQNIVLNSQVSQSLAGRVALLTLLPLSITELSKPHHLSNTFAETIFKGFYPRVYHNNLDPIVFYGGDESQKTTLFVERSLIF